MTDKRLSRRAQLAAIAPALEAVNKLVRLQFLLDPQVLKEAIHCQTDLYRCRHAACQVTPHRVSDLPDVPPVIDHEH